MKNPFKIPNSTTFKVFKTLKVWAVLLPLWGLGGFSCSLSDALKPTPQIDQYGLDKNATFACLVNGQKWEPAGGTLFQQSFTITEDIGNKFLSIAAFYSRNSNNQDMSLFIETFAGAGSYQVKDKNLSLRFYDLTKYPLGSGSKIPLAFEGVIHLNVFTPQKGSTTPKNAKGTFEFKTLDHKGDTLHITAGRFNYGN
jgi:hypothetical protein